jgi:site-specific DNA-methyltransferase (adenine-specific)
LAYKILSESKHSDSLGQDYESSLSESHRNKEGIYYTPQSVVDDMLSVSAAEIGNKVFLDPCCGGGNFIIRALEVGFKPENVYGFDTDENAVAISRKRFFDQT